MSAATANTTAAIVDPPGVSTVRATTSTGTSRIRISVRALGRFSGNKRAAVRLPARGGGIGSAAPGEVLEAGRAAHRPER